MMQNIVVDIIRGKLTDEEFEEMRKILHDDFKKNINSETDMRKVLEGGYDLWFEIGRYAVTLDNVEPTDFFDEVNEEFALRIREQNQ